MEEAALCWCAGAMTNPHTNYGPLGGGVGRRVGRLGAGVSSQSQLPLLTVSLVVMGKGEFEMPRKQSPGDPESSQKDPVL